MTSQTIASPHPKHTGDPDLIDRLCRLAELRAAGDLNDEEFELAKARLLA